MPPNPVPVSVSNQPMTTNHPLGQGVLFTTAATEHQVCEPLAMFEATTALVGAMGTVAARTTSAGNITPDDFNKTSSTLVPPSISLTREQMDFLLQPPSFYSSSNPSPAPGYYFSWILYDVTNRKASQEATSCYAGSSPGCYQITHYITCIFPPIIR